MHPSTGHSGSVYLGNHPSPIPYISTHVIWMRLITDWLPFYPPLHSLWAWAYDLGLTSVTHFSGPLEWLRDEHTTQTGPVRTLLSPSSE